MKTVNIFLPYFDITFDKFKKKTNRNVADNERTLKKPKISFSDMTTFI